MIRTNHPLLHSIGLNLDRALIYGLPLSSWPNQKGFVDWGITIGLNGVDISKPQPLLSDVVVVVVVVVDVLLLLLLMEVDVEVVVVDIRILLFD